MISSALAVGSKGFDTNTIVNLKDAKLFVDAGYNFAIRYIPRITAKSNDLSGIEVNNLLEAGLSLMAVQHVESENGWFPTIDKGVSYGKNAANYCSSIGLPIGTCIWLDLEGVHPETLKETTIEYCNNWFEEVIVQGYSPGIYLGWHYGLNANEAYHRLKFAHYWAAYNLNIDQYPVVRGVQMVQRIAHKYEIPDGIVYPIDVDLILEDKLGGLPIACMNDASQTNN